MRKILAFLVLIVFSSPNFAQELRAKVMVNSQQVQGTNKSVFDNLQTTLTSLINDKHWTNLQFTPTERINCSFTLTITKYTASENLFEGNLQVQANRPVFNSSYTTSEFALKDANVSFNFQEFDKLEFRADQIDNNLVAIFAYYAYLLIGVDMDTMAPLGGTSALESAQSIVNAAQDMNAKGWKAFDDTKNRFAVINDYLDNSMQPFRQLQYKYHREGLDEMATNPDRARTTITEALQLLQQAHKNKTMSILPQLFTEYKKDELINIFQSQGSSKDRETLYDLLMSINPSQSNIWDKLKQ